MYNTKEDQLLQKLQKCVGKLQNNQTAHTYRQPTREMQRPTFNAYPNNCLQPKFNSQHNNEFDSIRTSYTKIKQQCNNLRNYSNANNNSIDHYEKYKPANESRPTNDYLSDRTLPKQNYKQNYCPQPIPKQRRKYQQENHQNYIDDKPCRQSFKKNYQIPRKPLESYNLNAPAHLSNKQDRKIQITEQKINPPKTYQRYERSASKYDQYYRGQKSNQINSSNRRNILLEQDENRNKFEERPKRRQQRKEYESVYIQKKMQISPKLQKYEPKQEGNGQRVSSFNYMSSRGRQQASNDNLFNSRNKQTQTKSRIRNASIGSIASISKRNVSSNFQAKPKVSYQTFQPRLQTELNLKQILSDVTSTNQDTFTKLQKISQLNERINMRIKNIISTFENK